jgi:hypothetical protein
MKNILIKLGITLAALVAVAAVTTPAQAVPAQGTIYESVTCASWSSIWTSATNIYTGVTSEFNVAPCWTAGEHGGTNVSWTTSEPTKFWTGAHWCTTWWVNSGPKNYAQGGAGGVWTNTYPGNGYTGTWNVHVESWYGSWCP